MFELHPDHKERVEIAMSRQESIGEIYSYGSLAIKEAVNLFYKEGRNTIPDYNIKFIPNSFLFQYDLEVFIFLNYKKLQQKELEILIVSGASPERIEEVKRFGFTGLPAYEHIFNACAIRWPTYKEFDGSLGGHLVRHPWIEDDFRSVMRYTFTIAFGGAGQGKTHGFLAFMCLVWDHFIKTDKGAKCSFSTVSEDKLKGVSWPYLQRVYEGTNGSRNPYSLYAGTGKISSDYTIKRLGDRIRDTAGVFKGILVGNAVKQDTVTDKLTGTHGHPAAVYLIDELQSTPAAPIKASSNYLSSPIYGWVLAAGNYKEDSDMLGSNVRPNQGWENVDETTHLWESTTVTGVVAGVIHKNNNLSPGMHEPWASKCIFLPSREKLERLFPTASSRATEEYRRFWIGWRSSERTQAYVINADVVKGGSAGKEIFIHNWRSVKHHLSFDSAPGDNDRNVLLPFHDGYERESGKWVWGFDKAIGLPKASESQQYYRESSKAIVDNAARLKVPSGNMICDNSVRGGHPEFLDELGFKTEVLVYHEAPPDGKRYVERTKCVEPEIVVEYNQNGVPTKWAHSTCVDRITMGAYALRRYIQIGVVCGINKYTMQDLDSMGLFHDFEQEIYRRKMEKVISVQWGERDKLDQKKLFKKEYGFSPDVLDTMFQAAYYMWVIRGMPISNVVYLDDYKEDKPINERDHKKEEINELNSLWDQDLGEIEDDFIDGDFEVYATIEEDTW